MRNGRTHSNFKVGAVFDDQWGLGHYVVIKVTKMYITGEFLYRKESLTFRVLKEFCKHDEFIGFLSDLEMELL